jgi:hypothetical protein
MDNIFYDVTVDLDAGEDTTYSLGANFPDTLISETSHTLRLTVHDSAGVVDISGLTSSTCKIKKNDSSGSATTLATGTYVTDGTDGKINFTVNKDLIPDTLAAFQQSSDFPQILYYVTLEDADSKIQVRKLVSVVDIDGTGSGSANPEAAAFDYTPTTAAEWTSWTDSGSAPTTVGGALDDVAQRLNEITGALTFKGTIAVAADFPTTAVVENGYTYRVTATVTDNDATKTNTGQSFVNGDEIAWNGTNWTELGNGGVNSVNGLTGAVVIGVEELDDVTLTSEAQGDIIFRDVIGFVNLSPGTAGQYLKTNGAGANPAWETPTASQITNTPAGDIVATNVQTAIDELDTEKAAIAGATLTGDYKFQGDETVVYEHNTNSGFLARPAGGQYQTTTASKTGAIEIILPVLGVEDMLTFHIDVFDFATSESFSLMIGGYINASGVWSQTTVITSTVDTSKDFAVRFGNDGANAIIWIGELADTWAYPQVIVRDLQAGYQSDIDAYTSGWSIDFEATSFDTIGATHSNNLPIAGKLINTSNGEIDITKAGIVATLNRTGSTGVIQEFQDDGVTVGEIHSRNALTSSIVLDPRTNGAGLSAGTNVILPTDENGALSSDAIDLGGATRFKDIYLSGGVRATTFESFYVPANAMTPRTTNGASPGTVELATNKVMIDTMDFDQTTSEGVQFTFDMPDDWDLGTVKAKFDWTAASGSGTVTWTLAGRAFADNDAYDQAFGTAQSVTDTLLLANDKHGTSATSAITIAGTPALGDECIFEITRDISDTLTADAQLRGVHIQYKTLSTVTAEW